jgi:hypothetical protein
MLTLPLATVPQRVGQEIHRRAQGERSERPLNVPEFGVSTYKTTESS